MVTGSSAAQAAACVVFLVDAAEFKIKQAEARATETFARF